MAVGAIVGIAVVFLGGCEGDDSKIAAELAASDAGPGASAATTGDDAASFVKGTSVHVNESGHCVMLPATTRGLGASCDPTTGSARGSSFAATVPVIGDISLIDTGAVDSPAGNTVTAPSQNVAGVVTTGAVTASASSTSSDGARASVSIASVNLTLLGVGIQATTLASAAGSACGVSSGGSTIAKLKIAGVTTAVTGAPNQVIAVPGVLKIILNEQQASGMGMTVNAMHVTAAPGTFASLDVVVASTSASASLSCGCVDVAEDAGASDADAGAAQQPGCDGDHVCPAGYVCAQ